MGEQLTMNPLLQRKYEQIRSLLAKSAANEIRIRYEIGAIIVEVKQAHDKYGTQAVAQLAAALDEEVPTLYRYATVAERWTAHEVEQLMSRRTASGRSLCWSHFVLLANVAYSRRRIELYERVLREGLSVRQLAAIIKGEAPRTRYGAPALIARVVRATERWSGIVAELDPADMAAFAAGNLKQIEELLERAIAAHEKLQFAARAHLDAIRARKRPGATDPDSSFSRPLVRSGSKAHLDDSHV